MRHVEPPVNAKAAAAITLPVAQLALFAGRLCIAVWRTDAAVGERAEVPLAEETAQVAPTGVRGGVCKAVLGPGAAANAAAAA